MNKVKIYGEIGNRATADNLQKQLDSAGGGPIEVEIFSEGGSYFEGLMMYKMLKEYTGAKNGRIVGLAASMATYLMLACDKVAIDSNAYVMIHNPLSGGYGDYKDMENKAELLKSLASDMANAYASKCGDKLDIEQIKQFMDAETWLSAQQALAYGLVDEIMEEPMEVAASLNAKYLVNAPKSVKALTTNQKTDTMKTELIKALGLDSNSAEKAITAKVTDTVAKVNALTEELSAKSELIKGLNAKLSDSKAEADELKAKVADFSSEQLVDSLIAKSGKMVSDEVRAKLRKRVDSYHASTDESEKADRLEDAKMFIELYGVANTKANDTHERTDFTTKDPKAMEAELVGVVARIMKEKGYKPKDYAKAVLEAEQELKQGKS